MPPATIGSADRLRAVCGPLHSIRTLTTMRRSQLAWLLVALAGSTQAAETQPPAPDFPVVYRQDFRSPDALKDFVMTDPAAWKLTSGDQPGLDLVAQSRYTPAVRSPVNLALIATQRFGDFVLDCDLMQTGREYGHRDMCLFFGFQNPTNFYYVHIATAADNNAHNVFIVQDKPRTNIATATTKGVNWGLNVWHHVRLERRLADGAIRVWFDDMTTPIMTAANPAFGGGYIGFGSFDDTGRVANIVIRSNAAEKRQLEHFKPAGVSSGGQ